MANLVKIPECKTKARITPIEVFPDPKIAMVLTFQHTGAQNKPSVSVGDSVTIGQKIADSTERVSAPVHSPISGKVIKIEDIFNSCNDTTSQAIWIENDGKKTKDKTLIPIAESELKATANDVLIKRIREAGIIGLGGAGFPTHVKLSPPADKPIKHLIVNATEGEPYDTADERLLVEKTANLLRGVKVIRKILGNPKVIVATKVSKVEAIPKLQEVFGKEPETEVVVGHYTYQQGDASLLQKAILGYETPPNKRSYEMGTIVQNVATINAVANAVFEGEPLISRVTALNGDIENPKNLLVKIGTPISDILSKNNITGMDRVVVAGVMMGHALPTLDTPVSKRTSSIIVFKKSKPVQQFSCLRCSNCISSCPVRLHPIMLYEAITAGKFDKAEKLWMKDCIGCGTCSYVCPARLPLASTIIASKQ